MNTLILDYNGLALHARLEGRNAALIGQGIPYPERKAALFAMAAPHRAAIQAA